MTKPKTIGCSWSGGKDSCFALMKGIEEGFSPAVLLNVLNEEGMLSRSHGLRREVLQAQANAADLPIYMVESSWSDYEDKFTSALTELKNQHSIEAVVFGDIDLEAHRHWEEMVCAKVGLQAVLPLWQQDRKMLVLSMIDAGIETLIVSCNTVMGEAFLGRTIDMNTIEELERLGVDVCGENGEYHTLVVNCPLFKHKIDTDLCTTIQHNNYWFLDVKLKG